MGLFSDVLHIRDRRQEQVALALDKVLLAHGLRREHESPVPSNGPARLDDYAVSYAYGPLHGNWATVVQVAVAKPGAPWPADVTQALSKELDTYVLSLMVHDDDVLCYNLDLGGRSVDGYNSNPQYFETQRVGEAEVEVQRHTPEAFIPLLPAGQHLSAFAEILNHGWWAAHNAGTLDENGVASDESNNGFAFEGERMEAIGNLLQLHGSVTGYPYAAWGKAGTGAWNGFIQVWYGSA